MGNKKSKLILITTSFPFGKKEPLICNELPLLKNNFNEVEIITYTKKSEFLDNSISNESIHYYDTEIASSEKLLHLFKINWIQVFRELKYARSKYSLSLNIPVIKVAIMAAIRGKKFQTFIEKQYKDDLTTKNVLFYSWWCTDEIIGLANIKKKNEVKVCSRMHAYDLYFERHQPEYLPFRPFLFEQLNKVFVISDQGYKYLIKKLGVELNNLSISKLGVNNETLFNPITTQPVLRIVSCSALIPLKRVHLIIEALSEVNKESQITWEHFGDGPELNNLEKLANKTLKNLSNVTYNFHGSIDNLKLHSFYQENHVDLFINVSETEGIPISIMEAMSYGIPSIGTDVGGVAELITNQKNGFLLTVNFKPIELAKILESVNTMPIAKRSEIQKEAYAMWTNTYNANQNNKLLIKEMLSLSI